MSPAAENMSSRLRRRRPVRSLPHIAWMKSASCSAVYRNIITNDQVSSAATPRSPAQEQDPTGCVGSPLPKGRPLSVGKSLVAILRTLGIFAVAACHNVDVGERMDETRDHGSMSHYIPPSIARTVRYRCDDGSQISVDVFDDDRTLFLREAAGIAKLKAEREGGAFLGGGVTFIVTPGTAVLSRGGAAGVRCRS